MKGLQLTQHNSATLSSARKKKGDWGKRESFEELDHSSWKRLLKRGRNQGPKKHNVDHGYPLFTPLLLS